MTSSRPGPDAQTIGARLLASATDRERIALAALVEEAGILAQPAVQKALVWEDRNGVARCAWQRLDNSRHGLGLDACEAAFLSLVLSTAGVGHPTSLMRATHLDERRLAIALRVMIELSGCDTLTVDTRT